LTTAVTMFNEMGMARWSSQANAELAEVSE